MTSKQQTSLLSFFCGGGAKKGKSTNPTSTPAAAAEQSSANRSGGGKAKAASSKAKQQQSRQQSKKSKSAAAASSNANNKKRRVDDKDLTQNQSKEKAVVQEVQTNEGGVDSASTTTTPPKPGPDFSSFSYSSNNDDVNNAADSGNTPISIASTAASTPPCSPEEDNAAPDTNDNNNKDMGSSGTKDSSSDNDESDSDSDESQDEDYTNQQANFTSNNGEHKLSEYELLRLRNIERNNRRLAELGLGGGFASSMGGAANSNANASAASQQRKKKQRRKIKGDTTKVKVPAMPTRRSTRSRRSVLDASAEDTFTSSSIATSNYREVEENAIVEEEPEVFTVSPVLDYAMGSATDTTTTSSSDAESKEIANEWSASASPNDITCLKPIGKRLAPPNGLGAIYSLQFYAKEWSPTTRSDDRSWIVGAGKAGIVSLWDCSWSKGGENDAVGEDEDNMVDPILSWKAHSGRWVADVRFLPPAAGSDDVKAPPSRLLSAANDGCVCLWDLSAVSTLSGAPKLLSKTGKGLHRSGIFALDTSVGQQTYVCTGSKDKTVAVTTLDSIARGNNYAEPLFVSDYHTAKVGAVALCGKGTSLVASASDDGSIAVHDFRVSGKNQLVAELIDAHNRPHSVAWNPLSENELMTAGLDHQIKVFDIRSLGLPLLSYHGHVPSNLPKYKRIHHPIFYNPCRKATTAEQFVLSGGENSRSLSMWNQDAKNNIVSVYSRGKLPSDCGDAGCLAVQGERVASTVDGGEVLLLEPQVKK